MQSNVLDKVGIIMPRCGMQDRWMQADLNLQEHKLHATLQLHLCAELASILRDAGVTHEEARAVLADGLKQSQVNGQTPPPPAIVAHIFGEVMPLQTHQLIRAAALLAANAGM
jgi:hypothetical protein